MAIVDLFFTNDFNDKKKLIVVGLTETFAVPIPQIEVLTTQERTPLIIKNVTANDGVAS